MGEVTYAVRIAATPEQVWQTYVDPLRIPAWQTGRPTILDVRGSPGEPGSTYVSKRGPLAARTTVVAAEEPRELLTTTDASLGLELEIASGLRPRRAAPSWSCA